MREFHIRLNCIDHYQAPPTDFDPDLEHGDRDGKPVSQGERPRVPIVRIFGSTPTGQKVCAHVHGMFPYIYVQYEGSLSSEAVADHLDRLRLSIDHALSVSFRRDTRKGRTYFVAHVSLVKGVPFYGYYTGYRFFVKVYLYNPTHVVRLADLLRQGAVMSRPIQPFESHMQFVPQWMCDYNLFGCDYMKCGRVTFRSPVPDPFDMDDIPNAWHEGCIDPDLISAEDDVPRQSHCHLEVDVHVEDILNRHDLKSRPIHNNFNEATSAPTVGEKLVTSMAGLWKDETRRRKARMGLEHDDDSPFPPDVLLSVSVDPRDPKEGGWIHEEEYRNKIDELIKAEQKLRDSKEVSFDSFLNPKSNEDSIQTSFDSVADLYSSRLRKTLASRQSTRDNAGLSNRSVEDMLDVDEERALSLGQDEAGHDPGGDEATGLDSPPVTDPLEAKQVLQDAQPQLRMQNGLDQSPRKASESENNESVVESSASTTALGDVGIRDAGDYTHAAEDAFEIPAKYFGRLQTYPRPLKAPKRTLSTRHDPNKRPRLVSPDSRHPPTRLVDPRPSVINEELPGQESLQAAVDGNLYQGINDNSLESPKISTVDPNAGKSASSSNLVDNSMSSISQMESAVNSSHGDTASKTSMEAQNLLGNFGIAGLFCVSAGPPSADNVMLDLKQSKTGSKIYQDAYYSNDKDVPERGREYAGRQFRIPGGGVAFLPEFDAYHDDLAKKLSQTRIGSDESSLEKLTTWEISKLPPTADEVETWLTQMKDAKSDTRNAQLEPQGSLSQIELPTQKNKYGFKYSQRKTSSNVMTDAQYMSALSLEVHVNTRGTLLPDPQHDKVNCIFWCLQADTGGSDTDNFHQKVQSGALILADPQQRLGALLKQEGFMQVDEERHELDLLTRLVDIVRKLDPDILTGYEVHNGSWGYLIERARCKYEYGLCDELSRVKIHSHGHFGKEADRWGFNHTSTVRVTGRHMINIWRAMRGELNLLQYTMENVAFHILHRRIPHYAYSDLTLWYRSGKPSDFHKVIAYWKSRTMADLEILDQNELIPRTSEQARLLGVDFYAVFARGSQFKVESLMFRIAKPESFLLISPSRKQVGQQNALECLPLVMEPQSDFYTSPVLVLDFQSLYPSVMIAYNYCYSTFLGRVTDWRGQNKMGFSEFHREPQMLELLREHINVAPNGMMYARPETRKSLLAKMLGEILETRVMVKSGMKVDREDRQLQRLLNNRQLALKLIANVTYGYTSASFSGRMPCSEIADSIVQTSRETLERAIALIHSVRRWGAEIVYGDTDSLFVHLKGRTRDEAFDIGQEIAKAVTDANPRPVKLKFEKVYHPCILLAKKRYVGFKYESRDQTEPEFDAKGIETVRRDGTPAEQKIEETALKILFRTSDLSQVKQYFQRQCTKIMQGRVSMQDFCFAREVKLGTYSDRGPAPPGALVSARRMLADPRAEPQYGERVPYVVATGAPGARLIDRCVAPDALLKDDRLALDADYYITKNIIPPLERIFNLVGASVRGWYDEVPRLQRIRRIAPPTLTAAGRPVPRRNTIEAYLKPTACLLCTAKLDGAAGPLCRGCTARPGIALLHLRAAMRADEAKATDLLRVCRSCADLPFGEDVKCDSKDCPVFYSRLKHAAHMASRRPVQASSVALLEGLPPKDLRW